MKPGLQKTPKRRQKYSLGACFGYLPIADLPDEFSVGDPLEIKSQTAQTCVAQSLCAVSEYQEKVALEPAFTIKLISELKGQNWVNTGTTLEAGAKASLKGFLGREESPFSVEREGLTYCADPNNWTKSLDDLASYHRKRAWFWIGKSKKLPMFDAIRSALVTFASEKRAVQTGVMWCREWTNQEYIKENGTPIGGHAICLHKYKGDYLGIQNSYGTGVGKDGCHWIHRDLVNKLFKYGALIFADAPEEHDEIIKKSKRYRGCCLINYFNRFMSLIINK